MMNRLLVVSVRACALIGGAGVMVIVFRRFLLLHVAWINENALNLVFVLFIWLIVCFVMKDVLKELRARKNNEDLRTSSSVKISTSSAIFRYSLGIRILSTLLVILLVPLPILIFENDKMFSVNGVLGLYVVIAFFVLYAIYVNFYSVKLENDYLLTKFFVTKKIKLSNICEVNVLRERNGKMAVAVLKNGKKIVFNGMLKNFNDLVEIIRSRIS